MEPTQQAIVTELSAKDARAICAQFGYVPTYELLPGVIEDWGGASHGYPLFYYPVRCDLHIGGEHVGQGSGSCNSWEKKYRYRQGERACPTCGKPGTIIKGNAQYERDASYLQRGAWLCYAKKGGCGAKFYGDDPAIAGQDVGRADNPDFADIVHVVRAMANKRALISAVLATPGYAAARRGTATPTATVTAPAPAIVTPAPAAVADRAQTGAEWAAEQPTLSELYRESQRIAAAVGAPANTAEAQAAVARRKLSGRSVFPSMDEPKPMLAKLPANITKIEAAFAELRPRVTDREFQGILAEVGGPDCTALRQLESLTNYQAAYDRLCALAQGRKAVAA